MKPKITFVATSRNDNHGGDMLQRMTAFVRGLIYQANRCKLPCELVMVEWNPPKENPLLHTILPAVSDQDYLKIRYVVVPPASHEAINRGASLPIYQMIAKNVGIRRAEADWVLCTNVDLLFSDALFDFLAKATLDPNSFYRAHRCDVPREIDYSLPIPELLKWSARNILRRAGKFPGLPLLNQVQAYPAWMREKKWLLKILHTIKKWQTSEEDQLIIRADVWACGDFTMMTKANWEKMEGYLEFNTYSLHIDTLGLYSAFAIGLQQITLPMDHCTYHIFHENGWESFETPIQQLQFVATKHSLDWASVRNAGLHIMKNGQTWGLNPPNWGMADQNLEEIRLGYE